MKHCPACQTAFPSDYTLCPRDGSSLITTADWADGTLVRGKYRILTKVGQGGMGSVYKVMHARFNEVRAIKVISADLASDPNFVRRFEQEAIITRKLQHPNAVRVDDIDEAEDGRPFIVMEYIEGRSLKDVMKQEGPMDVHRVCSIIKQAAAALHAAHSLGLIHRDIKPANIALIQSRDEKGVPVEQTKILDFGIAKLKEAHLETSRVRHETLTGTGIVIGTPAYMSPEQAMDKRGEELDGRADIYSLGVVMYEMFSGRLPLTADSDVKLLMAQINLLPPDIRTRRPDIPSSIAEVVMRCLQKLPDGRPTTAQALIAEIERWEGESAPLPQNAARKNDATDGKPGIRSKSRFVRWAVPIVIVALLSAAVYTRNRPVLDSGTATRPTMGADSDAGRTSQHEAGPPSSTKSAEPVRSPISAPPVAISPSSRSNQVKPSQNTDTNAQKQVKGSIPSRTEPPTPTSQPSPQVQNPMHEAEVLTPTNQPSPEIQKLIHDAESLTTQGQFKEAWSKAMTIEQLKGDASTIQKKIRDAEDAKFQELSFRYVSSDKQNHSELRDLLAAFQQFLNNAVTRGPDAEKYVDKITEEIQVPDAPVATAKPEVAITSTDAAAIQRRVNQYGEAVASGDIEKVRAVRQLKGKEEKKMIEVLKSLKDKGFALRNCSPPAITGENARVSCESLLTKSRDTPPGQITFILKRIYDQWFILSSE